ncbi:MAG: excinuclease ABC subunit UvrC [Acidimicrobiia bacterium]|nr:excinuclease ABC subunit UvrC [Acidimicrobiia bacterium]MDH5503645.1 excinuclease ABC subunit UvrC [Acidimicrobiia bacterium]
MQRPPTAEIPDAPGVYLFRDAHGQVLYVGKAKSLRKRVLNYFSKDLAARTRLMVSEAESVDFIIASNEVEALMLEFNLVQKHKPRFNIRLRDDKSFPHLTITRRDEWPAAKVRRGKKRPGDQHFGPYAHAYAIRNTLDLLLKAFPIRTCSDSKFRLHESRGRPCLLADIEKCSAPCVGAISPDDYRELVDGLAAFLNGDSDSILKRVRSAMLIASEQQLYEQAARHRDRLRDLQKAIERQEIASERPEDFDVVAIVDEDLEASVFILIIRRGRVVGRFGQIIDKVEDVSFEELTGNILRERYGQEDPPRLIILDGLPEDPDVWTAWLTERRGGPVELRVPRRGGKRKLLETAHINAREQLGRHRLKRQSDPNARAKAINSLQEALHLPAAPLRIECFDISTLQGRNTVASMVVLEDGLPRRSDYRRFKIKTVDQQDDFASMEEVLRRRFTAYLIERELPPEERGKFAYPPGLLLIDGGLGQLGRAVKVLDELGLDIPVAGLAKRMEEVYLPGTSEPVRIPRDEPALYLLQRVRDEAHRFAITYHRSLRGKRMVDSVLDDVAGVGPTRKKALLRTFGSLKRLRDASVGQLEEVVPAAVAREVFDALHG